MKTEVTGQPPARRLKKKKETVGKLWPKGDRKGQGRKMSCDRLGKTGRKVRKCPAPKESQTWVGNKELGPAPEKFGFGQTF